MSVKLVGLIGIGGKGMLEAFWGGARAAMIIFQKQEAQWFYTDSRKQAEQYYKSAFSF